MIPITSPQSFPDDSISPKKKEGKEFAQQLGQAIWSRYSANRTYFGMNQVGNFQTLRSYSDGRQSDAPYRDWFTSKGGQKDLKNVGGRKGYANVDFRPWSPAAKYKSVIQSVLASSDYKIKAKSLNPTAIEERLKLKWSLYLASKLGMLTEKAGITIPQSYWRPQNREELELYEQLGGFKLAFEEAIEMIAEHTFQISDWPLMRGFAVEDAIDLNFLAGRVYVDKVSGATKVKHVKPANMVMAWVDEDQTTAPSFVGHLTKVKLADIKMTLKSQGYTDNDLLAIAKSYYPYQGTAYAYEYFLNLDPVTNRFRWEDFNVDVLEYEYLSYDTEYYTARETKDGVLVYNKEEDRKVKGDYGDGRKRTTDVIGNLSIYEGKYVIGTNITYDYGRQKNIMREDKDTVYSSYFFERISGQSITERCLPLYDSLQKSWLKLQAAKWAASPKGYSIDLSALANIDLGDGALKPKELIEIARQNGIFAYRKTMQMGKVIGGSDAIQEREGGIGRQLDEWLTAIQFDLMQIMDFSGITPTMAASPSESPDKLKGVMQMEVEATNNALFPLRNAIMRYKEKAAKSAIMKSLVNIKYDPKIKEYYTKIIGADRMRAIEALDQTTLEDLTITLEAQPSDSEKQMLLQRLETALQVGKDGAARITTSDYLYIHELIKNDNLRQAGVYLAYSEARAAKRDAEIGQAQIQANTQAQIQSSQAAIDAEIMKEKELASVRINEMRAKYELELQKEMKIVQLKNEGVLDQIALEASLEARTGVEITGKV